MKNIFLLLILSILSVISCKKQEEKKDGPKPYPVISVETRNVTGYDVYPAAIKGVVNNDVRAKIQGYITQVLVDEGQYVTAGQPLFRLETNMLSENADAAKSGITAAQANVSAARAAVNAAQVEVNKLKPLVEKNIISNVQLQTALANLARAQAQLSQAVASQQQASANYKSVQANINYSIIRAPISGIVGKLPLKVGSLVGPSDATPLTTISDTRSVYAYFSMNEKEYLDFLEKSYGATVPEKIKNLPNVELELANGSLYPEKGRIEVVTGQIDPATGTIQFRVGFPNPSKLLTNGNSGAIRFPKFYDNTLVVPESATYEQQGMVYLFKVEKDTAAEEATYLSKLCNKVTMLVRKDHFRASKAMIHKVNNTPNIEVKFNHELIAIEGENNLVERAVVINNQTQETSKIDVHGIFIAIGHKPNTDLFAGQIALDENGYIITEGKSSKTNLPGVFAAGDVQDHIYRQAITAAGSGCMAAIDAERYLSELE